MPQPSFTAPERLMIGRILDASESTLVFEAAYLVPSAVLVAIGFAQDAPAAFAAAFAIIAGYRLWQVASDRRAIPVLRGILRKYEQACAEPPGPMDVPARSAES
jgi:hypothetical protein